MNTLIIEKLNQLRLYGMSKSYSEQSQSNSYQDFSFDERVSLLLERELLERENRLLTTRLSKARLKQQATMEQLHPSAARGLDRATIKQLIPCDWVNEKKNILITGASGCGKTFLATALLHKACLLGNTGRYYRMSQLLSDLEIARIDGRYRQLITTIGKIKVLIIDDFCLSVLNETEEKDLFELIEERHHQSSTIFTSQNPTNLWHSLMPNSAIADALLDRIVHQTIRIEMKGESMRKKDSNKVDETPENG